jgi:transcriptional regulator with XRE-family HTH domain
MTPAQCRMARAALTWSVRECADKVGITPNTISSFELERSVRTSTVARLRDVFIANGVVFDGATGGVHIAKAA